MSLKEVGLFGVLMSTALLSIDFLRAVAEKQKTGKFERPYELPLTGLLVGITLLYIFSKE